MVKPLKAIIAHHSFRFGAARIIIEDDGILLSLATQESLGKLTDSSGQDFKTIIHTIFLLEDD